MVDEKHEPPLTDDELKAIRETIEQDKRAKWLWASIRLWCTWIAAASGFAILIFEAIFKTK